MRLAPEHAQAIREEVCRRDPSAVVYLFGSRVDDAARGGDIDLLVLSRQLDFSNVLSLRRAILDRIGWQQLDLVVRHPAQVNEPLVALGLATGIRL